MNITVKDQTGNTIALEVNGEPVTVGYREQNGKLFVTIPPDDAEILGERNRYHNLKMALQSRFSVSKVETITPATRQSLRQAATRLAKQREGRDLPSYATGG